MGLEHNTSVLYLLVVRVRAVLYYRTVQYQKTPVQIGHCRDYTSVLV